jgi:hypothetical protein
MKVKYLRIMYIILPKKRERERKRINLNNIIPSQGAWLGHVDLHVVKIVGHSDEETVDHEIDESF